MKQPSLLAAIAGVMLIIGVPAVVMVSCPSCAMIQPGQSALVVRAEQTAAASFTIVDACLAYEKSNRDALFKISPEIKKAADAIRAEAPKAFDGLRTATRSYKANRTPENEADLATWLAVVEAMTAKASSLMLQAKGVNL